MYFFILLREQRRQDVAPSDSLEGNVVAFYNVCCVFCKFDFVQYTFSSAVNFIPIVFRLRNKGTIHTS